MEKKLIKIFVRIFGSNVANSVDKIELNKYPKWDSLRHINLMMEIEKNFNLEISNSKILELKTFRNIMEYLKKN